MWARLPGLQAILPVYAVIVVMLAGWTIAAFLWKVSAWLLLLNLGEIFTLFAYALTASFLESLLILLLLLALSFLFPPQTLRDHFVVRGTILAFGLCGALMAFVGLHMKFGLDIGMSVLLGPLGVLMLTTALLAGSSATRSMRVIQSVILWISDRLMVFLYILLPLFVMSSLYLVIRNLV